MGTNYYAITPGCEYACDHCAGERIHLGKSSFGWTFTFRGDPQWSKEDAFDEWLGLVSDSSIIIEDEYGRVITKEELYVMILRKMSGKNHASIYHEIDGSPGYVTPEGHSFTTTEFC